MKLKRLSATNKLMMIMMMMMMELITTAMKTVIMAKMKMTLRQ